MANKAVFDMTREELNALFLPLATKLRDEAWDRGLPAIYQNKECPTPAHFIHKYKDGRKLLIKVDASTGQRKTVKRLH